MRETLKIYIHKDGQPKTHPSVITTIIYGDTPTGTITRSDAIEDSIRSIFPREWLHIDLEKQEIWAGTPGPDTCPPIGTYSTTPQEDTTP